jgi:hypothetical protein
LNGPANHVAKISEALNLADRMHQSSSDIERSDERKIREMNGDDVSGVNVDITTESRGKMASIPLGGSGTCLLADEVLSLFWSVFA